MAWYRFAKEILDEYARLSNEYRQYSFTKDIRFVLDRDIYTLEYTIFRLTLFLYFYYIWLPMSLCYIILWGTSQTRTGDQSVKSENEEKERKNS